MRSALTCLGIIVGIAAVIAMVEIGQGSAATVRKAISNIGANVVQIDPADAVKAAVSTGSGGRVTLTPEDFQAIRRECGAARWAAPSIDCHAQVVRGSRNWAPHNVLGTSPDFLLVRNWADLADGAPFTEEDVRDAACVCLMGQTPARELFPGESPVGQQVRIKGVRFRVVGLLRYKGASVSGADQDDYLIAPWTTIKYKIAGVRQVNLQTAAAVSPYDQVNTLSQYPSQEVQLFAQPSLLEQTDYPQMTRFADLDDIWVSAVSPESVPLLKRQIRQLLRERHGLSGRAPDDFRIRDLTEISQALASTSALMTNLLLCVALISLVVGGVGIMNIMLVAVTERTREIGLRMAVGARARDILRQFLAEAVLVCLLGGIVGILAGRCASLVVSSFLGWRTAASIPAILGAVVVSITVGVIFGYYPAWKASRLDPIDALRYE